MPRPIAAVRWGVNVVATKPMSPTVATALSTNVISSIAGLQRERSDGARERHVLSPHPRSQARSSGRHGVQRVRPRDRDGSRGTDRVPVGDLLQVGRRRVRSAPILGRPRSPDLGDLAIAIVREALVVAPKILVQLCDLLVGTGLAKRRLVEDLAFGDLRAVDLAGLGNRSLLLVRERALIGAGFRILLPETLHRELERALRSVVGHWQVV